MNFRDLIESATMYAWFKAPQGHAERVSSNITMTNDKNVGLAISNMQWMLDADDVKKETGNTGTANYDKYIKTRFEKVIKKSKNNKEFAKNLNTIFNVKNFTDKDLF